MLTPENGSILPDPKSILEEETNFHKNIYQFKANQCEGLLTLEECAKAISSFHNDKRHSDPTASPLSSIIVFDMCLETSMIVLILPFKYGLSRSPKDLELFYLTTAFSFGFNYRNVLRKLSEITFPRPHISKFSEEAYLQTLLVWSALGAQCVLHVRTLAKSYATPLTAKTDHCNSLRKDISPDNSPVPSWLH